MTILYTSLIICLILMMFYYIYKVIIYKFDSFSIDNNIYQYSSIDGNKYYVHNKHEDMQLAADIFAKIDKSINNFLNLLYEKYKNSDNYKRREVAELMMTRYHTASLRENSPLNVDKDTSYTINKGDIIAICIRSGINYGIHDIQTIMFVVLHELTHLAIKAYDHPDEFWQVFKFVLEESESMNIYISPNYALHPVEYCGITINYSPRWDFSIPSI